MADEIGLGSESDGNESPGANLFRAGSKKTYGLANSEDVTDREEVSINDIIEQLGHGKFQIILTVILGMILLADGCEIMLISLLGPKVRCVWKLSVSEEALINSVVMLGFTLGATLWGFASDKFGRRRCLIASTANVVYFGVLCSQVPSFKWLLVTRFFVGFNVGCALQVMTMFTEFLPASTRARTIILAELFWVVGSQFAVLLGLGTMNSLGWRWFLAISTLPLFIFLLCCKVKRGRLKDLFNKEIRFHYIISMFIWFASGFGYYGIVLLGTEMFQTGISGCSPYGSAMKSTACGCHDLENKDYIDYFLTAFSELPGLLGSTLLVSFIGSKKTISLQFGLASVFIVLLMVCTSRTANVILMFGMRGCIAGAWLTGVAYTSETLPTNVRALGIGICNTLSRLGAIITSFVAQVVLEYSFYVAISVYGMTLMIACIAALLLPKEIKGKPLQISATKITESVEEKLLGVTLDKKLDCNNHVDTLSKQGGQKLHALAHISNYVDGASSFVYIYLVHPLWSLKQMHKKTRLSKIDNTVRFFVILHFVFAIWVTFGAYCLLMLRKHETAGGNFDSEESQEMEKLNLKTSATYR